MIMYDAFPVAEQGRGEEAFSFSQTLAKQFLPVLKNLASDEKVVQHVRDELIPTIKFTREDRQQLEAQWREISNMVDMKHDGGQRYFGRSNQYLPIYRRERDKLVSTLSRGLFPGPDYFDCIDRETGDSDHKVKSYMQWEMERNAKLRIHMKKFLYQYIDFGVSPMKYWYKKKLVHEGRSSKVTVDDLTPLGLEYKFTKRSYEGLAVSPRKLAYWYIYPTTCESIDDAFLIFEDIDINMGYVEEMKSKGRWMNTEQVFDAQHIAEHKMNQDEMLDRRDLGSVPQNLGKMYSLFPMTEAYTFMVLPRSEYLDDEDKDCPVPVKVVLVGDAVVEVKRNPFFHQRPPYVAPRMGAEAGGFYGSGVGKTLRSLQCLANDFVNQTNDNGILAMNPVALINPNMMVGPPKSFAPGVPWYVNNVNEAVKFDRPPLDQTNLGLALSQFVISLAQDNSGAPPDRTAQGRGAKTATGMQIMQRNSMVPAQDMVEDLEQEAMVELLHGAWMNAVQYRDATVMAIAGGGAIQVEPADLAIDAEFSWVASTQTQNNQVRSQQAISLIQAIMPVVPLIMQNGYVVDFVALVKKIYSEGFGFQNFEQFIRRAQAAPGMGPPMPGQMPGIQAEQGDRMRSAMEQVTGQGGGMEAQPGEAEDFMQVREEADDLAAILGGGGGM